VKPAGLGARDTLRLESGLCLYGNDLNEDISPVSASLVWCIGKGRRDLKDKIQFIGSDVVLEQIKSGTPSKRVGFIISKGGAPAREHTPVLDSKTGNKIGEVCSGTMSPILKQPIGMAYINVPFNKLDTKIHLNVRGKNYEGQVAKMPFVDHKYYKS